MLRSDPSSGSGKPEPLKHNLYGLWFMVYGLWFMVYGLWFMVYGLWSKRISQKDRLIYKFNAEYFYIFAIGGHYANH
nr:type II toxin-antitoxin system YoeB family toxin [Cognaticolwellia aestuarii]